MKYLVILAICLGSYLASRVAPQADGVLFFVIQSMWSYCILTAVLLIERSNLAKSIALIELSAIFLNLFACVGYLTSLDFFYYHYEAILISVNAIEACVLLRGAPWNRIFNGISALCSAHYNRNPSRSGLIQAHPVLTRKDKA